MSESSCPLPNGIAMQNALQSIPTHRCLSWEKFVMAAPTKNGAALNARSRTLLEGLDRSAARAMFKGIGFSDDDLKKPIIGIANTWTEIGPCNFHLRLLAHAVKE